MGPAGWGRVVLAWLLCWLVGAGAAAAPLAPGPSTRSLAEALNPDGTLRPGLHGSFDARRFRLRLAPDGRPAFSPLSTAGAGDENWQDNFRLAGANGPVYKVLQVGAITYLAGRFSYVGSVAANGIVKWDGTTWSSLGTGARNGVLGNVSDVVAAGTDLYVGGTFTTAGGVPASHVAKWDGTAWSALGAGISGGTSEVNALALVGNALYVGGDFAMAGGAFAISIAKWDGSSWSPLGSGVQGNTTNGIVYALGVRGSLLYVGGGFSFANSVAANNIATWDGTTWASLGTGPANGCNRAVAALAVAGADLYAVGDFTTAGGTAANRVARWNGTAWSSLGTGAANGTNNSASAVCVVGSSVYVGGYFSQAGGVAANRIARWDGTSWGSLGTGAENGVSIRSGVFVNVDAIGLVGTDLYLGGTFTQAGSQATNYLARWDGTAWNNVGTRANGANGPVYAVAVAGSDVYVGGDFTAVGNVPANHVAKWNGTAWSALTMRGPAVGEYYDGVQNGPVYALLVAGSSLYVGGKFQSAGNVNAGAIARWDGSTWSSLGTGAANGLAANGTAIPYVYALALAGTTLYVGGTFDKAGGAAASNVARWSGTAWSALGTTAANGTNSTVMALALLGTSLYVGGDFTAAGAVPASRIAKWEGSAWSALGPGVSTPLATGSFGVVYALLPVGNSLYVGGYFTTAGGLLVNNVARWDGSTWSALGKGTTTGGYVMALTQVGTSLYVGGYFTSASDQPASHVARWDGSTWSSLGTGLSGTVRALATGPGSTLNVGGEFNLVGDGSRAASFFSRYETAPLLATAAPQAAAALSIYPNPARASFRVSVAGVAGASTVQAELVDALGQVVRRLLAPLPTAGTLLTVPTADLAPGAYVLRLQAGPTTLRQRVLLL
ncbi:hypothetical protein GCM10027422_43760 [Hymenobacter arcticus]